jgi:hypothetical protein
MAGFPVAERYRFHAPTPGEWHSSAQPVEDLGLQIQHRAAMRLDRLARNVAFIIDERQISELRFPPFRTGDLRSPPIPRVFARSAVSLFVPSVSPVNIALFIPQR